MSDIRTLGFYRVFVLKNCKEINIDRLSKNFEELDTEGKDTLLKIGEKVFNVNNFVNKEIASLLHKQGAIKFKNEKLV
jgi:hypothetical protein